MRETLLTLATCVAIGGVAAPARAGDAERLRATTLLDGRADALASQHAAALRVARTQAVLAQRLWRRRELRVFARDADRAADAHAADLALVSLRRGLDEARRIEREQQVVAAERARLDAPASAVMVPSLGAMDAPRWSWPVHGSIVGAPGRRREAATSVELDPAAVEIMARVDEPVAAPAEGVVRRIERLADGRSAVVITHGSRWVSVLAGLRSVAVAPWDRVDEGSVVGVAARNGDAAAIVTFALWRTRAAGERGWVDPRAVLGVPVADAAERPRAKKR